jgi:hypothetical protein
MDGSSRGTMAVALGYLLAFSLADANGIFRSSWVVLAIAVCGALAAGAGIRAFPGTLRLLLGAASTGGLTVLSAIGFPLTVGLLLAAVLMGGATLSLFEARHQSRSRDSAAR